MLKPLAPRGPAGTRNPMTWRTWTGLVIIPVIVLGGLALAFWAPMRGNDTAKVAVVNNDEPATVNGQIAPLGREMAAKMVDSTDSGYTWAMTDDADASAGLADGSYAAVVRIPKEFSRHAASSLAGKPLDATWAMVQVQASPAAPPADAAATVAAARQSVDKFNRQVIEMYLNGVYGGFSTMHEQLGKAADGAGKLADGSGKLAGGTDGLVDGTGKLDSAAKQLADGAGKLADGTGKLADGSGKLSGGLTQAEQQTAALPEMAQKLADGAKQVAAGNRAMANTITPLADAIIAAIDAVPTPRGTAAGFADLARQCPPGLPTAGFCDQLRAQADRFSREANAIDDAKDRIRKSAQDAKDAVGGLAYGSEQVAHGNQQLAHGLKQLAGGISQAAGGSRQLTGGIQALDGGAHQLSDGLGQFASGTGQLAGGTKQLAGGAHQLADGNKQMADGMATAGDKIPNYSDADREHLKTIAASPAAMDASGPGFGKAMIALLVAVALWAGALGAYAVVRAIPPGIVASREPTWRIIAKSAVPGGSAALAAAAALSLILAPFLDLSFGRWSAFFGVTLLAAVTFTVLNQALVAVLKRPGRFVSVAVLVLTVATGVISTVPDFFTVVGGLLPTHGAIQAMSAIVTGNAGADGGIAELFTWLVIGTVASALAIDRQRVLSGKDLRNAAVFRTSSLPSST